MIIRDLRVVIFFNVAYFLFLHKLKLLSNFEILEER